MTVMNQKSIMGDYYMTRPTTKNDLRTAASGQIQKIFTLIDSMSEKTQLAALPEAMLTARMKSH